MTEEQSDAEVDPQREHQGEHRKADGLYSRCESLRVLPRI